jgi:hypothetical protein
MRKIRILLSLFVFGLVLSGITAFPLVTELEILNRYFGEGSAIGNSLPGLGVWISKVQIGLIETDKNFPFILYGTDWLAFAHIVIAIAFWGPLVDPVKNKWVVQFGLIACLSIFPLALICGPIRHIPFYWRLIDCSFGIVGALPLLLALKYIREVERGETAKPILAAAAKS